MKEYKAPLTGLDVAGGALAGIGSLYVAALIDGWVVLNGARVDVGRWVVVFVVDVIQVDGILVLSDSNSFGLRRTPESSRPGLRRTFCGVDGKGASAEGSLVVFREICTFDGSKSFFRESSFRLYKIINYLHLYQWLLVELAGEVSPHFAHRTSFRNFSCIRQLDRSALPMPCK